MTYQESGNFREIFGEIITSETTQYLTKFWNKLSCVKKIVIAKNDFRNWRKIRFLNNSYKIHKI